MKISAFTESIIFKFSETWIRQCTSSFSQLLVPAASGPGSEYSAPGPGSTCNPPPARAHAADSGAAQRLTNVDDGVAAHCVALQYPQGMK